MPPQAVLQTAASLPRRQAVQGFRQTGPGGLRLGPGGLSLGPDEHTQNMCVLAIFATAVRSRLPSLPIFL